MANKNKYWISKMLSGNDDVSSKRVAGMVMLVNIVIFCYIAIYGETILPEFMFEAVCFLTGGLLGITVFEGMFKKNPPTPPSEDKPTDETTQ